MYIESSAPRLSGDRAILRSPGYNFLRSTTKCVEFWYHAYGQDIGTLRVRKRERGEETGTIIFEIGGEQGNEWHVAQANLIVPANKLFYIQFEGVIGKGIFSSFYGDIAIDDYLLKDRECEPYGNCDFEEDMCAWKNAETGVNLNWILGKGQTSKSNLTGPSIDHTSGTAVGGYVFVSTTYYGGKTAKLVSPVLQSNRPRCFEFWYHKFGNGNSVLTIYQKGLTKNNVTKLLLTINGNKGDQWNYGSLFFPANFTEANYIIEIEGKIISSSNGDIALDDIVLTNDVNECRALLPDCAFKCKNGTCLNENKICNFINDCEDGEEESQCGTSITSFENDFNSWNTTKDSEDIWKRSNYDQLGLNNGPKVDNTFKNSSGYYLSLNKNNILTSDRSNAQFSSPILIDSSSACKMIFYYQIEGKNKGQINIYNLMNYHKLLLTSVSLATNSQWIRKEVVIGRYRSKFQIIIEGLQTLKVSGYLAIDDVEFQQCALPQPTSLTCRINQYTCDNKVCIGKYIFI